MSLTHAREVRRLMELNGYPSPRLVIEAYDAALKNAEEDCSVLHTTLEKIVDTPHATLHCTLVEIAQEGLSREAKQ